MTCALSKFTTSAEVLLGIRNDLCHSHPEIGTLTIVATQFNAARALLECFGTPCALGLQQIVDLETQYYSHKKFKEYRIRLLGWLDSSSTDEMGPGGIDSSLDFDDKKETGSPFKSPFKDSNKSFSQDKKNGMNHHGTKTFSSAADLLTYAEDIKRKISYVTESPDRAYTTYIMVLQALVEVFKGSRERAMCGYNYDEAERLHDMCVILENTMEAAEKSQWIGLKQIHTLRNEADTVIAELAIAEQTARSKCHFAGPYGCKTLKQMSKEVIKLNDVLRQLLSHIKLTFPKDFDSHKPSLHMLLILKLLGEEKSIFDILGELQREELFHHIVNFWEFPSRIRFFTSKINFVVSELREAGYSACEVKNAGYHPDVMMMTLF
jgi:hypothetical protein